MDRVNDVDWARTQILKAANKFFANADLPSFDDIPLSFNPAEIAGARQ
jgi:hypothetical protein